MQLNLQTTLINNNISGLGDTSKKMSERNSNVWRVQMEIRK